MCECMCVHNKIIFPMLAGQQPDRMSREQRSFPSLNIHIRADTTFNTSPLCRKSLIGSSMWFVAKKRNVAVPVLAILYSQSSSLSDWRVPAAAGAWGQDAVLYSTWRTDREISDMRSQLCCLSVISSSGGSVLTVEGVGVFLWSPEISGLGGTLLELLELAMCLLSPWGRLVETEEPVVEREKKFKNYKPTKPVLIVANDQQNDALLWSVDLRDFWLEVLRCPLWEGDWVLFVRSVLRRGFIDSSSS